VSEAEEREGDSNVTACRERGKVGPGAQQWATRKICETARNRGREQTRSEKGEKQRSVGDRIANVGGSITAPEQVRKLGERKVENKESQRKLRTERRADRPICLCDLKPGVALSPSPG
jgi:hypothetical protein